MPGAPQLATEAINRIAVRGGTRNWAIMWMAPAILRALATGVYWGWASVIRTHIWNFRNLGCAVAKVENIRADRCGRRWSTWQSAASLWLAGCVVWLRARVWVGMARLCK